MVYPAPDARLRSWLEAGLHAHQQGDIDSALAAYRQILAISPEHPGALNLLGTGLLQLGNAPAAVPYLERAARGQRHNPGFLANLAQGYLALKRYGDACQTFRKASRLAPDEVQFHIGIGAALAMEGRLDEAQAMLERLSVRFPQAPLVWMNLGNVFRDRHRFEDAMLAYRNALECDPGLVEARNSLGSVLHSMLRFAEAETEYRACIEAAPDFMLPRYNLASVTMDLGRFREAEAISRDIVARAPQAPAAHRLLGTACGLQGRLLDAIACYRVAAQIAPDDPQVARTYGSALMETGHPASGLRWLGRARALDPESIALTQLTATALLALGSLQEGWSDFVSRPAALELREKYGALEPTHSFTATIAGRHVCVLAEQGLGDQLFFLRYAPLLAARGARVSYGPSGKLHSLLERVSALDKMFRAEDDMPQADLYVLAGDLPRALHADPSSLMRGACPDPRSKTGIPDFERRIRVFWPQPASTLRIAALPERLEEMRRKLGELGPAPYIGITWRGGTAPEKQQTATWLLFKSIGLPALADVLKDVPGTLVAIQRKPEIGEIDALSSALGRTVHDLSGLNNDLESMLAVLELIDEYVGVSNTNMHLRAAAGRTARVLVPTPPEWRWMSGGDSPWFPGFGIYRQSLQGDWNAALAQLHHDLRAGTG